VIEKTKSRCEEIQNGQNCKYIIISYHT